MLPSGDVVQGLREPRRRNAHPLEHGDRNGPMVEADDDQRHVRSNSFASAIRPALTRSRMPESNARCQSASSELVPPDRSSSRPSDRIPNRVSYSAPISVLRWRFNHVASAGLRPPVPIATTRSPWRTTDISVKEQLAGSSAEFTKSRRSSPARLTAAFTLGWEVAVTASQASSRAPARNLRLRENTRPPSCPESTSETTADAPSGTSTAKFT